MREGNVRDVSHDAITSVNSPVTLNSVPGCKGLFLSPPFTFVTTNSFVSGNTRKGRT